MGGDWGGFGAIAGDLAGGWADLEGGSGALGSGRQNQDSPDYWILRITVTLGTGNRAVDRLYGKDGRGVGAREGVSSDWRAWEAGVWRVVGVKWGRLGWFWWRLQGIWRADGRIGGRVRGIGKWSSESGFTGLLDFEDYGHTRHWQSGSWQVIW